VKKLIPLLITLSMIALVASCVVRRERTPNTSLDVPAEYPSVCQGQQPHREEIFMGATAVAVKCSCVVGQEQYAWYNALTGQDYQSACMIVPGQAVLSEPLGSVVTMSGYSIETNSLQTTTTTTTMSSAPPFPSIIPFTVVAPPTNTVVQPPAPVGSLAPLPVPPVASAKPAKKEPAKFAAYVRETSVKYTCKEGLSAERTYNLVMAQTAQGLVEQTIKQQCLGPSVGCLSGADAKNYLIPPCNCPVGLKPELINSQGLWTCH
jgi:hypothetical protein